MAKIKNRNVSTLPRLKIFDKNNTKDAHHFGEFIENSEENYSSFPKPISFYAQSDSDTESLSLDLNKLSGISSSSSLSWSDECYERESSKKVYEELRKLDRVLKGEDEVPERYDKEEFNLWMKLFPNLTIFDCEKTPVNSVQNLPEKTSEESPNLRFNCDTITFNVLYKEDKKSPVIDIKSCKSQKLLPLRSPNLSKRKSSIEEPRLFSFSNKPQILDHERYLKISPLQHKIQQRKSSSRSLISRQTSREFTDINEVFNSLPFIKIEETPSQHSNFIAPKEKRKSNGLILPPIANDPFRSASALPRKNSKTLSALSMNIRAVNFKRKNSNDFLHNNSNSSQSSRIERKEGSLNFC